MKFYAEYIPALKELMKEAGEAILEIYNAAEGIVYTKKDDDSPLTRADQRSNEVLCAGLEKLSPKLPIISEENKAIDYQERSTFDYCWMIDPLDGTKEFIKRNGEFTINLALIHEHKVVLGMMYVPCTETLYWGIKDGGAFVQKDGAVNTLKVPDFEKKDEGLKVVCSRSHFNAETENVLGQLNQPETVSVGSALKFMLIAQGDAHVYPRAAPTMEWDTAAAQIIVEEAGGKVLQLSSNQPLVYNKENLLNPYFIAYGNTSDPFVFD